MRTRLQDESSMRHNETARHLLANDLDLDDVTVEKKETLPAVEEPIAEESESKDVEKIKKDIQKKMETYSNIV